MGMTAGQLDRATRGIRGTPSPAISAHAAKQAPVSDIAQFYGQSGGMRSNNPWMPQVQQQVLPNFASLGGFLDKGYFQRGQTIPGTNIGNLGGLERALGRYDSFDAWGNPTGQITPQAIQRTIPGNVLREAARWQSADLNRTRRQGLGGLGGLARIAGFGLTPYNPLLGRALSGASYFL